MRFLLSMNSLKLNILKGMILFFSFYTISAFAQCDDRLLTHAIEKLDQYVFVRDFKVRLKKTKRGKLPKTVRYSIVLNKGMKYVFAVLNAKEYDGNLIIGLSNAHGNILSNHMGGNLYDVVEYTCRQTGVYYLTAHFSEGKEGCGICVVGMEQLQTARDAYLKRRK